MSAHREGLSKKGTVPWGGRATKARRKHPVMPPAPSDGSVEQELRAAIERSVSELTAADLVVATGVPRSRVEEILARLLGEYPSGTAVTESGELLYRFTGPGRADSESSPTAARILKRVRRASGTILRGIARRAPLVVMAGYFALFLTIPFPPALVFLAVLLSSWSDIDLLDYYGTPHCRETARTQAPAAMLREYLFGSTERRVQETKGDLLSTLSTVRDDLGVISLRDILVSTGLELEGAREFLDQFLVRFTGEPEVTTGGRLVYRFPDLLKSGGTSCPAGRAAAGQIHDAEEDRGARRKQRLIAVMNLSNLLFSVYYGVLSIRAMAGGSPAVPGTDQIHPGVAVLFNAIYSFAAESHAAFVLPGLFFALGVVPFGVASIFFVLHRRAAARRTAARRQEADRRLRREVYAQVFDSPERVDPTRIKLHFRHGHGRNAEKAVAKVVDELAASYHAEIEDDGEGHFIYHFPELAAEGKELSDIRRSAIRSRCTDERIVFDSRERVR